MKIHSNVLAQERRKVGKKNGSKGGGCRKFILMIVAVAAIHCPIYADQINDLKLFNKIKIGQNKGEVLKIAGNPILLFSDDKWYYGGEPKIDIQQSPISPYRLLVEYRNDLVIRVVFYSDHQDFVLENAFEEYLIDRILKSIYNEN